MSLLAESNLKVGENRGNRRVWIEGSALIKSGFTAGAKFVAKFEKNTVTLLAQPDGDRKVSGRTRGEKTLPIVDINTGELERIFKGYDRMVAKFHAGKIVITPTRTALKKAARVLTMVSVGMFVGGGLLSQAAKAAGFPTVYANEVSPEFAEVHAANHDCVTSTCSIEDANLEEAAKQIGPVGLYHAGIPCEPFSAIRRNTGNKKADSTAHPEAHELGDMTFWNLRAIDIFNPHTAVLEEVPQYLDSASWQIAQHALRRMGYTVDSKVINAADHGGVTARKRAVIVATQFETVDWPAPVIPQKRMRDFLLPAAHGDCEWFTRTDPNKQWLFNHWETQREKGNGLISAIIDYNDLTVGTIKKRYLAGQGDNQVVLHPDDRTLHEESVRYFAETPVGKQTAEKVSMRNQVRYRWLTVGEIKRIMTLPDAYDLGTTKTLAGEILGQGVHVDTFTRIIRAVTRQPL